MLSAAEMETFEFSAIPGDSWTSNISLVPELEHTQIDKYSWIAVTQTIGSKRALTASMRLWMDEYVQRMKVLYDTKGAGNILLARVHPPMKAGLYCSYVLISLAEKIDDRCCLYLFVLFSFSISLDEKIGGRCCLYCSCVLISLDGKICGRCCLYCSCVLISFDGKIGG